MKAYALFSLVMIKTFGRRDFTLSSNHDWNKEHDNQAIFLICCCVLLMYL